MCAKNLCPKKTIAAMPSPNGRFLVAPQVPAALLAACHAPRPPGSPRDPERRGAGHFLFLVASLFLLAFHGWLAFGLLEMPMERVSGTMRKRNLKAPAHMHVCMCDEAGMHTRII